jgi:predicted RNA binding protein YcfA (HicA-like mRNA interferase family)
MSAEKRFSEVRRQLESAGWVLARISGSHHVFTKPGQSPISIPVHGNKVKPVYVRKIKHICEGGSEQERR